MQREYLILMQNEKSVGAVRVEQNPEGFAAEIDVDLGYSLEQNSVFKAYFCLPLSAEVRYMGVLDDHKGRFELQNTAQPFGIALTEKNTKSGEEKLCCLCAEQGMLAEVKACFAGKAQKEQTTKNMFEKEYVKSTAQALFDEFPEFDFEKINGFFLQNIGKIGEYIMSDKEVSLRIAQYGYYFYGQKRTEKEFFIAIPSKTGENTPFENCEKFSFKVKPSFSVDEIFYCIIAGTDENGEYFRRKK